MLLDLELEDLLRKRGANADCAQWRLDGQLAVFLGALFGASAASFRYRVSNHTGGSGGKGGGLGAGFAVLEGFKKRGLLLEYSAGQTALEQIFNQFASGQENPEVE